MTEDRALRSGWRCRRCDALCEKTEDHCWQCDETRAVECDGQQLGLFDEAES